MTRSVVKIGRDLAGEWAWMILDADGGLIDSDWGFASYEAAALSATRSAKNHQQGRQIARAVAR